MEYIRAFCVGGLICAAVQILLDRTKWMAGRIMVMLVCLGVLLSAVGLYEPFFEFSKAGASVLLLGFGNVLWKGTEEAILTDGLLGVFTGGLSAAAGGICAALVFGYLASIFFTPKMKK